MRVDAQHLRRSERALDAAVAGLERALDVLGHRVVEAGDLARRLRRRDGEYRWQVDTGMPYVDEAGRPDGYVGTVIDIHDRILLQEELLGGSLKAYV